MGEEYPLYGIGNLYVQTADGKEIKLDNVVNTNGLKLHDEDMEVKQSEPKYRNGSYSIDFTVQVDKKAPIIRFFQHLRRKNREERKALLWAVTHGYVVGFWGVKADEEKCEIRYECHRPREVRRLLQYSWFVPKYDIYDMFGNRCRVHKGRIKPEQPFSVKELKHQSKKLKKYKV